MTIVEYDQLSDGRGADLRLSAPTPRGPLQQLIEQGRGLTRYAESAELPRGALRAYGMKMAGR